MKLFVFIVFSIQYVNFGVQTKEIDATPEEKDAMFYSQEMKTFFENCETEFVYFPFYV